MTPQAEPPPASSSGAPSEGMLTIDVLDDESGMAEVEDDRGRSFEVPAEWLPEAAEGLAYRVTVRPGGVAFTPLAGGARALRERSKQTLLEFSDEHDDARADQDAAPRTDQDAAPRTDLRTEQE